MILWLGNQKKWTTEALEAIKCARAEQQERAGAEEHHTSYSLQQWKAFSHLQLAGELHLRRGI